MADLDTRLIAGILLGSLVLLVVLKRGIDVHAGVSPA